MNIVLFLLGLSFAINLCLIAFLIFVFRSQKLTEKVYDSFDKNVETINEAKDPFRRL